MIGDLVSSVPAHPERGVAAGLLLVLAGVAVLVAARRPARRRSGRARVRCPQVPFAPELDDSTRVIRAQQDLTEVFPAPWGAQGVRRG